VDENIDGRVDNQNEVIEILNPFGKNHSLVGSQAEASIRVDECPKRKV
jgi:hypothetical protein